MKLPWVSRKEYNQVVKDLRYAESIVDDYRKQGDKEEYEWLIQLEESEDCEDEHLTVTGTHVTTYGYLPGFDSIVVWNENEKIGSFNNVEYYVRIDKAAW